MQIRKIFLFLIIILIGINSRSQTVIPGGWVSGIWDSTASPYFIQDNIFIHEDSSLYIQEGVDILFSDSAYLQVNGYIAATGTEEDSVVFMSQQNSWMGVRILHNDSTFPDELIFDHCHFSDVISSPDYVNGGALMIESRDDLIIQNSSFVNNFVENKGGAIYIENSDFKFSNCSFETNRTGIGTAPGSSKGGAVYISDSDGDLDNLYFRFNESVVAGALYSDNSDLELEDCIFLSNSSLAGGGAFVAHKSGIIALDDCTFEKNYANGSGGAIAILEGVWARFRNCSIIENISETELYLADGGGVLITPYDNEVRFINCFISNNKAGDYGGGVYATSDTDFIGCLFKSNKANLDSTGAGGGGAILMSLSYNEVLNTTFSGNSGGDGTSILCEDAGFSLINSIIWDDTIEAGKHKIFLPTLVQAPTLYVSHSDIEGGVDAISGTGDYTLTWAEGNIADNPGFEVPGTDFALSNESPCIDVGRNDTLQLLVPTKDIAGNPRIFRRMIDMGCYENQFAFGISENKDGDAFVLYPNPTGGQIFIKSFSNENINGLIRISDMSGKEVYLNKALIDRKADLNVSLSGLAPGFYILNFVSPELSFTKKLILK